MNLADRPAVVQALNNLPHNDRSSVTKAALEAAVKALPDAEAEEVRAIAKALASRVNRMGSLVALEVLAAIGILLAESGGAP